MATVHSVRMSPWYLCLCRALVTVLVTGVLVTSVTPHTVLLVPTMQVSHVLEHLAVGEALVGRGHQVYVLVDSQYPQMEGIRQAGVHPLMYTEPQGSETYVNYNRELPESLWEAGYGPQSQVGVLTRIHTELCWRLLSNTHLMGELRGMGLDFVLVDGFLFSTCLYLIPHNLTVPYGYMGAFTVDLALGIPSPPSFVANLFLKATPESMTFVDRLQNTFFSYVMISVMAANDDVEMRRAHAPNTTSLLAVVREAAIVVLTSDHILDWARPALPNTVTVSGITIRPALPLPSPLHSLMEGATGGVIVVTFGSSIDSLPVDKIRKLLDGFRSVPEVTVVFRMKDKTAEKVWNDVPENVHLLSWLPQQDILAHPNTKLFITHCGNNGQYEAVYHGVPMIGFPLFADQFHNCMRMEDKKVGVCMNMKQFTAAELSTNIRKVLNTEMYTENAEKLGAIIKDGPLPRETIARKIEHVLKFGAEHLHSASQSLPIYRFLMLDILAVVVLCVCVMVAITKLCLCMVWRVGWRLVGKYKSKMD